MWSYSAHKQFKRCQRQWFYKNVMAKGQAKKDPLRVEATRLSKLKTIAAWRGLIVDQVITVSVIPQLKMKRVPTLEQVLSAAQNVFNKWYEQATTPLQPGQQVEVGLLEIETNGFVSPETLSIAWNDIERALTNFMQDDVLIRELLSADYLIEQRHLFFKAGQSTTRGTPDLIAFWHNQPPVIYDWKVHFFGTTSHERQLLVYALALVRGKPHVDFEQYLTGSKLEDTRLTEVQLITQSTGYKRTYSVTATKLEATESFISDSILSMYLAGATRTYAQSSANDYDTAADPEACSTCAFHKLCKQH